MPPSWKFPEISLYFFFFRKQTFCFQNRFLYDRRFFFTKIVKILYHLFLRTKASSFIASHSLNLHIKSWHDDSIWKDNSEQTEVGLKEWKYFWKQFKHSFLCKHQRQVNLCWHNFCLFSLPFSAFLSFYYNATAFCCLLCHINGYDDEEQWQKEKTQKKKKFLAREVVWLTKKHKKEGKTTEWWVLSLIKIP